MEVAGSFLYAALTHYLLAINNVIIIIFFLFYYIEFTLNFLHFRLKLKQSL